MSPLNKKDALRDAILVEELRARRIQWRYAALSAKIAAYSEGGGEPPTPEEFRLWAEDGKELERIRAFQLEAAEARKKLGL